MGRKLIFIIISMVMLSFFSLDTAFSESKLIYGCAECKLVMLGSDSSSKCPDDSVSSVVKEGYIVDGKKIILNTFSEQERKKLGIKGDNKAVVVIYRSPYTGEVSFAPGQDKFKNQLEKNFIELKYGSGNFLSSEKFGKGYELLGAKIAIEKNIEVAMCAKKKDMQKSIDGSWPIFSKQHKQLGLSDEIIKSLWERQKKQVYEQYGYNPTTDEFKSVEEYQN